ncbi:MAG: hypothetical protein O7B99_09110 [Planctomycetota bacterium]|nr:hypothetical protein [Planctomycetota bacterium]
MASSNDRLTRCLADASEVVFVCSGNMVRSAFAELYARHLELPLPVRSLATTYRNDAMFPDTALALRQRGVDAGWIRAFRPTHVADGLRRVDPGAVLLVMSHRHFGALEVRPELAERAFLLAEVVGASGENEEIADPVEEGADFERTFATVARCVERLVERLRRPD